MSALKSQAESSSLEEEQKRIQNKISLSNCGVCGSEKAKYRCPACLTHSCSLLCVKKHKDDSGCSGVRNKTAFVALSHFDEMALLSDYRFLEDTGRFSDGASRDSLVRVPRTTLKLKLLASQARKMNITLRFLPLTFTKRRENSTVFNPREKMFLWHLKLMFPQSSSEFSQRRVPDRHTLKQILTTYIHPTESDPVTRQKLKMYVNASSENVKVFMKAEGRKANSVRYHELDTEKSLKDNLSFKMLIEYPVLHVVLRDQWKDYPLKGPAEPASACTSLATKNVGIDGQKRAVDHVSPPSVQTGTNLQTAAEEISPESEPPLQKRAKRGVEEEEPEEGEILDSSDEEEMLERNQAESIPLENNTSVNDMKNMQHDVN
ncbi:box C/D snoRNA protein 1 [Oryzias latipes]|uniref:Box C/D snoRNA protein 1 n=1 Tax=Oryzias latipes TaxID=8090 RepID=H2M4Y2_ORYLA|nr:box C/D snoRNA protein 1 [Oryzias latipes]